MKTVVIWDSCEADIKFFVVDRDVSHLDQKYVNCMGVSDEECEEISNLAYDGNGKRIVQMSHEFPTEEVLKGAKVIVCGFMA